jgi:hypothetical protein
MLDDLRNRVLAATLADEGPNLDDQPSRLWCSRSEYQDTQPVDDNQALHMPVLIESLRQLNVSSPASKDPRSMQSGFSDNSPPDISHLVESFQHLHTSDPHIDEPPLLSRGDPNHGQSPVNHSDQRPTDERHRANGRSGARESNKATSKAHQIMDRITVRLQACIDTLVEPVTQRSLAKAKTVHRQLWDSLQSCNRQVPSVIAKRADLERSIRELGSRIDMLHKDVPEDDCEPVYYNTGTSQVQTFAAWSLI